MENIELEGVNIVHTGVVVWDSNVRVTALLIVARFFLHICLIGLLPLLLQGMLVLPFRLPRLSLKVLNYVLIHR